MDKIIKISIGLVAVVVIIAAALFLFPAAVPGQTHNPASGSGGNVTVYFFYGEECPHCHNILPFMQSIRQKYPEVDFYFLETWHNETNNALSNTLNRELGVSRAGVPEVVVGSVALIGEKDIPDNLEQVILTELKKKRP